MLLVLNVCQYVLHCLQLRLFSLLLYFYVFFSTFLVNKDDQKQPFYRIVLQVMHLGVIEESSGELQMISLLINEMLEKAQTCLQSMVGHVDTIIAERRVIRQSVKSLRPTTATSTKDSSQPVTRPAAASSAKPSPDLVEKLSVIQASVEQLTTSSSSMLQVYR